MPSKKAKQPKQDGLFGVSLSCPDIDNLPLIVDPMGSVEVRAPGSIYQPLLLTSPDSYVDAGPGRLDAHEEAFVRDLIRFLCPSGNYPLSGNTPLKWGGRDVWVKRNIEKRDDSFRLRVDDSDWFYPDFIVWIVDRESKTQTFGFVDPKGLIQGARAGWADYKIVSTLYMPHVVESQLHESAEKIEFEGEEWVFRVRGVLVSTSALSSMQHEAKFHVRDGKGNDVSPSEADFNRARIVFQKTDNSYIPEVLRLLTEDSELDDCMSLAALLHQPGRYFTPAKPVEFELDLRKLEANLSESGFVAGVVQDYLKPDDNGLYGTHVTNTRRGELTACSDKAIWDHECPSEAIWKIKTGS